MIPSTTKPQLVVVQGSPVGQEVILVETVVDTIVDILLVKIKNLIYKYIIILLKMTWFTFVLIIKMEKLNLKLYEYISVHSVLFTRRASGSFLIRSDAL